MSTTQLRIAGMALFFILIFVLGLWLSRSGKPYPALLFNIHKLLSLGALVYLGLIVSQVHRVTPLGSMQVAILAITALCYVSAIATGGLLSIEKTMPAIVHRVHQVLPYLVLLSTSGTLFSLLVRNGVMIEI